MKRREFLSTVIEAPVGEQGKEYARSQELKSARKKFIPSEFANRVLPSVPRSSAGLEPYAGTWGPAQISHLLRRTMFGARPQDVSAVIGMTPGDLVDTLLTVPVTPDPPINTNSNDTGSVVGTTWINAPTSTSNGSRHNSMRAWWVGLMLDQGLTLSEKMTLFWHNHFATETAVVKDARVSYRTNALLRQYALGNFRDLTKQVTIDCGMLKYLNGNTNTASNPNENYGRELQELFTIGKGPEIAPENYTNYTEQDVQQAARVLSGWRDDKTTFTGYFTASRHDAGDKQFSSAYQDTVITGQAGAAGANEVDDLLDMIFLQNETAKYVCRKIYRWFVYYIIDSTTETNVIAPLADIFRTSGYEIAPVLSALFKSAHFFDPVNFGCMIKSPMDLTTGTARTFSVEYPDTSNLTAWQNHRKYLYDQATTMQQQIGDPPNVAGWPAYYQDPLFYEMWINSDTLANRTAFTDVLSGTGYTRNGFNQAIDPVAFANLTSAPGVPDTLIDEWAGFLYAFDLTPAQKIFLKDALLPGLPDYEWTIEWTDFMNNPTDPEKKAAITTKLRELLGVMLAMPEYQLM